MRTIVLTLALAGAILAASGRAQQPPANTEIYLAPLKLNATPMITGPLVNISHSPGYDSQPSFLPDGSAILFSSQREGTQYDIYRYDIASQKVSQVTHTAENENSPLVTPDGKTFSVVQTEADKTQRLWRFDLDGTHPQLVLADVKPVGYHLWTDATHLLLFVLGANGQPNTLQYADTATGKADVIDSRIGRALLMRPGKGTASYISQPQGSHAVVKEFDPKTRATTTLVETPDTTAQDCAWLPNGTLLMSSGSRIFAWTPAAGTTSAAWTVAADLASEGVGRITRMAVGPADRGGTPRFALVAEPVVK